MDYFWLKTNKNHPIILQALSFTKNELTGDIPTVKKIFTKRGTGIKIFSEYLYSYKLHEEYHLISDNFKKVISLYMPHVPWIPCALVDEDNDQYIYWFLKLPIADQSVLHSSTTFGSDYLVKNLVISQENLSVIKSYPAFEIQTEAQRLFVFRLDVVESILRRKIFGLEWDRLICC